VLGQLQHALLGWLSVEIKERVKECLIEPGNLIENNPKQTKTVVLSVDRS
jgi:hypothetical protein